MLIVLVRIKSCYVVHISLKPAILPWARPTGWSYRCVPLLPVPLYISIRINLLLAHVCGTCVNLSTPVLCCSCGGQTAGLWSSFLCSGQESSCFSQAECSRVACTRGPRWFACLPPASHCRAAGITDAHCNIWLCMCVPETELRSSGLLD